MSMSTRAAQMLGHPPGLNFRPDDNELVAFFLLPSARGEPAWFPGVVVIQDDTAANTLPWNLLRRHGLDDDDEAYFLVHSNDATARKDLYCDGGGTWVSQRPVPGAACIGGEEIKWRRINLNLHMGRGKRGGGSTGWVMHEYTLTEPACPFVKIWHVAFSGHGKDRKRVPDNEAGEPASTKRARIDAAANYNGNGNGSKAMMDQGYGAGAEHGFGEEGLPTQFARDFFRHLIDVTNTQACPASEPTHQTTVSDKDQPSVAHASSCTGQQEQLPPFPIYQEGISSPMAHQQQMVMMPLPSDDSQAQAGDPAANNCRSSAATCAYGSTRTVADQEIQDDSGAAVQCWPSPPQLMVQEIAGMEEQQYGGEGDQKEQQEFWDSIGVDTDNLFKTVLFSDLIN